MLIKADARIRPGQRLSPKTEFQPGQHWRPRRPWYDRAWLVSEYAVKSTGEIAMEHGVTDTAIQFWLKKHGIPARDVRAARSLKHWGLTGAANPMYGRRGDQNPNWRGGLTPARQALYSSIAWRSVARAVRRRDPACRLCGALGGLEIHHIEPFASAPLLACELGNLIRLCGACHKKTLGRERWWRNRLYRLIGVQGSRAVAC